MENLAEWIEGRKEGVKTIMGEGDFNARTGRKRGRKKEENEGEEKEKRKSIDKKKNKDEIKLVEFIREKGWSILNGNEKRNWTYRGKKELGD